jgi:hypothetical protein
VKPGFAQLTPSQAAKALTAHEHDIALIHIKVLALIPRAGWFVKL